MLNGICLHRHRLGTDSAKWKYAVIVSWTCIREQRVQPKYTYIILFGFRTCFCGLTAASGDHVTTEFDSCREYLYRFITSCRTRCGSCGSIKLQIHLRTHTIVRIACTMWGGVSCFFFQERRGASHAVGWIARVPI
jgi:hypothetical protein